MVADHIKTATSLDMGSNIDISLPIATTMPRNFSLGNNDILLLLLLYSTLWGLLCLVAAASSSRTPRPIACTKSLAFVAKQSEHFLRIRCLSSGGNKWHSTTRVRLSSTGSTPSIIRDELRYISGRRALLLHPTFHPSSMSSTTTTTTTSDKPNDATNHARHPPLVVLGGMAQSISNWEFHLAFLSQHRSVLMYEPIGQGPPRPPLEHNSTLDQCYDDVSLQRQGEDFWNVVDEAFFSPRSYYYQQHSLIGEDAMSTIDVASFSFGGRVALAAATLQPNRIRHLHSTGVGAERDALANIHIACWRDLLANDSNDSIGNNINRSTRDSSRLRSFAWSIILASYSEQFLASAGPDRIKAWVESVCQQNTEEGLRAILIQTHDIGTTSDQHLWTPAAMAQRIQASQTTPKCRVLVGSKDTIVHPSQALRLAEMLNVGNDQAGANVINDNAYKVVDGCGHAVPMEAMRVWREDVLEFLSG